MRSVAGHSSKILLHLTCKIPKEVRGDGEGGIQELDRFRKIANSEKRRQASLFTALKEISAHVHSTIPVMSLMSPTSHSERCARCLTVFYLPSVRTQESILKLCLEGIYDHTVILLKPREFCALHFPGGNGELWFPN